MYVCVVASILVLSGIEKHNQPHTGSERMRLFSSTHAFVGAFEKVKEVRLAAAVALSSQRAVITQVQQQRFFV